MREELDEKEDNCKQLNTTITQLKDASINMQKSHDFIIQVSLNVAPYIAQPQVIMLQWEMYITGSAPKDSSTYGWKCRNAIVIGS